MSLMLNYNKEWLIGERFKFLAHCMHHFMCNLFPLLQKSKTFKSLRLFVCVYFCMFVCFVGNNILLVHV